MQYALMSLDDFTFIHGTEGQPLYFPTYDEAELYAQAYRLPRVAVVAYEEE